MRRVIHWGTVIYVFRQISRALQKVNLWERQGWRSHKERFEFNGLDFSEGPSDTAYHVDKDGRIRLESLFIVDFQ